MNVDDWLIKNKLELQQYKKEKETQEYLQPKRVSYCCEFLVPPDYDRLYMEPLCCEHVWLDAKLNTQLSNLTIIHGHKQDGYCSGPRMCHIYGFWPTKEYHWRFVKLFESLWIPRYTKNEWEIKK